MIIEHICSSCAYVFERGLTLPPCPNCRTVDARPTSMQESFALMSLSIQDVARSMVATTARAVEASHAMDTMSYSMRYRLEADRRRYAAASPLERLRLDLEADWIRAMTTIEYGFTRHVTRHVFADLYRAKLWIVNTIIRKWPEEFAHEVAVTVLLPNQTAREECVVDLGRSKEMSLAGCNVSVLINNNGRGVRLTVDPWIIRKKEDISHRGY